MLSPDAKQSANPFSDEEIAQAKRYRTQRNLPQKGLQLRLDGSPLTRGKIGRVPVLLGFDAPMNEWLRDRAASFGVPLSVLVRDVLATWRLLVLEAETDRGLKFGEDGPASIAVPERYPGYRESLRPEGLERSHLDGSPLTLEEMTD